MHLDEGSPILVTLYGVIECKSEEEKNTLFIDLKNLLKKECRVRFEDKTGILFEIDYRMVSPVSTVFLLVGQGRRKIPFIFLLQDIIYPFRDVKSKEEDIQKFIDFINNFLQTKIPPTFREHCKINIKGSKCVDGGISLNMVESISGG